MRVSDISIRDWTTEAIVKLSEAHIASASLDAEIILAHTLRKSRTWLHAHDDTVLGGNLRTIADERLKLRLEKVPIAYIIGHKEFYGRRFHVDPSVLIPRPESENTITLLAQLIGPTQLRLLDVGTGSGCLGITAKLEHPTLKVTLSDVSQDALGVAKKNARSLTANVSIVQSNLMHSVSGTFDIILANLPYVDKEWAISPDAAHEPALALFAEDHGLALIKTLLTQAHSQLSRGGRVFIEADPCQHATIVTFAQSIGYLHQITDDYIVVLSRD